MKTEKIIIAIEVGVEENIYSDIQESIRNFPGVIRVSYPRPIPEITHSDYWERILKEIK